MDTTFDPAPVDSTLFGSYAAAFGEDVECDYLAYRAPGESIAEFMRRRLAELPQES